MPSFEKKIKKARRDLPGKKIFDILASKGALVRVIDVEGTNRVVVNRLSRDGNFEKWLFDMRLVDGKWHHNDVDDGKDGSPIGKELSEFLQSPSRGITFTK